MESEQNADQHWESHERTCQFYLTLCFVGGADCRLCDSNQKDLLAWTALGAQHSSVRANSTRLLISGPCHTERRIQNSVGPKSARGVGLQEGSQCAKKQFVGENYTLTMSRAIVKLNSE